MPPLKREAARRPGREARQENGLTDITMRKVIVAAGVSRE
jgi:hypothetical protein